MTLSRRLFCTALTLRRALITTKLYSFAMRSNSRNSLDCLDNSFALSINLVGAPRKEPDALDASSKLTILE